MVSGLAPGRLAETTRVGKSTLVSLIPRFYDVSTGSITLDGQDIRDFTLESLRRQISIVLQDVFLFNGSVRENILFGKPGASEQEVKLYWTRAQMYEFQLAWVQGYEAAKPDNKFVLTATYRPPWEQTMRDEYIIDFHLPRDLTTNRRADNQWISRIISDGR
jgi:ABC-type oligopeptide transport system ATPase subunit